MSIESSHHTAERLVRIDRAPPGCVMYLRE